MLGLLDMKFSFELPWNLFKESSKINDFEYFLDVFDSVEVRDVREFFKDAILKGREVFLDNSLYERKIRDLSYNEKEYKDLIRWFDRELPNNLKKNLKVIVPDFYEDSERCIRKVHNFIGEFPQFTLVAVVHGHNKENFKDCFKEYTKILREDDIIAVSAGDMCCSVTPRSEILLELSKEIEYKQKIHFLGLKEPIEILQIRKIRHLVDSIDTSYPVISTILGNRIFESSQKPTTLIYDIFDSFQSLKDDKLLYENVNSFKDSLL